MSPRNYSRRDSEREEAVAHALWALGTGQKSLLRFNSAKEQSISKEALEKHRLKTDALRRAKPLFTQIKTKQIPLNYSGEVGQFIWALKVHNERALEGSLAGKNGPQVLKAALKTLENATKSKYVPSKPMHRPATCLAPDILLGTEHQSTFLVIDKKHGDARFVMSGQKPQKIQSEADFIANIVRQGIKKAEANERINKQKSEEKRLKRFQRRMR